MVPSRDRETLTLARAEGLTTHDAAYLELAIRRDLPLSTPNTALGDAARRSGVAAMPWGAVVPPRRVPFGASARLARREALRS